MQSVIEQDEKEFPGTKRIEISEGTKVTGVGLTHKEQPQLLGGA